MNKVVLFTEDIFSRVKDEDIETYDVHGKFIIFETCRLFNIKQKIVELVFSASLFEEPRNIQFSVLVALNDVEDANDIIHMLPDDCRRFCLSDTVGRFFVGSHALRKSSPDEYNTDFFYYLTDRDTENKTLYRLHLSTTDQMLISKVISMANRGYLLGQYNVSDMMDRINVRNFVTLKYDPEDEYEIIDHHFTKLNRNKGILSVIFRFDGIESHNKYFLLSIHVTNNRIIFRELLKKNKYKNKDQFLDSLNTEKYRGIQLIRFDDDCVNIDYVSEEKFDIDSKPLTRSYFYAGNIIFDILMHQRANLFEKIVNTYL